MMNIHETLDKIAPESEAVYLSDLATYARGYLDAESKYRRMIEDGELVEVVRCKECKWFNDIGCAIGIVDDTDKPSEEDYCSYAERITYEEIIHQYHERRKEVLKEMSMPVGRNVMDALRERRTDETD